MKFVNGGHFGAFLISRQHRAKAIGGREHDLGKIRAVKGSNLGREHVFELMCEFAKFVEPASRGIPF